MALALEAVDELLQMRDLVERLLAALVVELHLHAAGIFERVVIALVEGELAALEMDDRVDRLVEQVAVVADHEHGVGVGGEILLEPQRAFEIEIVGRLVEQQQVGLAEQHAGQRHAHAPAARKLGGRAELAVLLEAEPLENGRGARLGGVRVDVGEPHVDVGDPVRVGRGLGLGQQRGALGVGRQHRFEHRQVGRRRFLRHAADAGPLVDLDRAAVEGQLALDQLEQRGLARAVLADKARSWRRRAAPQLAPSNRGRPWMR